MKRKTLLTIFSLIALLAVVTVPSAAALDQQQPTPPTRLTYQGHLLNDKGTVVDDGTYAMTFSLWDAATGGTQLWGPETHDVETSNGFFAVTLGAKTPIEPGILASEMYLEISVGGETLAPRQALESVAFALASSRAEHAGDADLLEGKPSSYYVYTDTDALEAVRAAGYLTETGLVEVISDTDTITVSYADVDWGDVTGIPPGFADGIDDDTIYTDTDAIAAVSEAGYLTDTGVIELISSTETITINVPYAETSTHAITSTNAVTSSYAVEAGEVAWGNVTSIPSGLDDGDDVDDVEDWTDIQNRPPGLDDGDDDTIYTDTDALEAVQTAGYVTETGVIDAISSTDTITASVTYAETSTEAVTSTHATTSSYAVEAGEVAWSNVTSVPTGLDDGDDVDDTVTWDEVHSIVGTGADELSEGNHIHPWGDIFGIPSDLRDGDDDTIYTDTQTIDAVEAVTRTLDVTVARAMTSTYVTTKVLSATHADADALDGQNGAYYRDWSNLTNVPSGLDDGDDLDDTETWTDIQNRPSGLDDGDDDTTYSAGTGLGLSGTEFNLAAPYRLPQTCLNGQVAKWDGTSWSCNYDEDSGGDITAVNAGNQLSGGGTTGSVTLDVQDGAGSGLDADTLDGQQGSDYASAAHGHPWGDLTNVPSGLDDGDDVDDTEDWTDIQNRPSGLDDGDDDTTYSAGNQLSLSGTTFGVEEGSGSGLDADQLDGQNGAYYNDWNNLTNVPSGLDDGDDDTQLSESQVVDYAGGDFFPMEGEAYVVVDVTNDSGTNGSRLKSAYATASSLTPHGQALSADNRAVVFVPPGRYDVGSGFTLDTEYVDVIGLSDNPDDQYIYASGLVVIEQTADDVTLANLRVVSTYDNWGAQCVKSVLNNVSMQNC